MTTAAPFAGGVANVTVPPAANPPTGAGVTVKSLACSTLLILASTSPDDDTAKVKANTVCEPLPVNVLVLAGRRMVILDPDSGAGDVEFIVTLPPVLNPPAAAATV